jgi:hypothetical protein
VYVKGRGFKARVDAAMRIRGSLRCFGTDTVVVRDMDDEINSRKEICAAIAICICKYRRRVSEINGEGVRVCMYVQTQ